MKKCHILKSVAAAHSTTLTRM